MKRRWVTGAVITAAVVTNRMLVRPWHVRWGATDDEVHARLAGDELVVPPAEQSTRAITIDAPPEQVWPWVVQIGADRGGFYSYDWLENLFGLGIHSTDRIVAEWQTRVVGDFVAANSARTGGWYVMEARPNDALVLKVADVEAGRPIERDEAMRWEFVWTFALRAGREGTTRLLVRERVGFGSLVTQFLMGPMGLVSFVMTRRMMLGIKSRAERHSPVDAGTDRAMAVIG